MRAYGYRTRPLFCASSCRSGGDGPDEEFPGDAAAHPGKFGPELGGEENAPGADGQTGGVQGLGCPGVAGVEGVVGRSGAEEFAPR